MKKIFHFGLILAFLLALVPVTASANGPIKVVDLFAGQDIDVGEVQAWNDATTLYVKYVIDEPGWCLTETHLHVSGSLADIPQTKNGSPKPGHFEYSMSHDCVTEYTYTIPLPEYDPVIAAHAVVKAAVDGCYDQVWQIGDVESVETYPDGTPNAGQTLLTNYADEFNWTDASPYTAGPGLSANQPDFTDPFIVDVTPTNEFPYNSNFVHSSAKFPSGYATNFDVQWDGHLHFGGMLTVSWSPGQSASEMKVVSPGFTPNSFSRLGTPSPGQGYFLDKYPVFQDVVLADPLSSGTHTINFQHTSGDGTFWDWIRLERPCEQSETAWGAGTRFVEKGNWATYFSYTIELEAGSTLLQPGWDHFPPGDGVVAWVSESSGELEVTYTINLGPANTTFDVGLIQTDIGEGVMVTGVMGGSFDFSGTPIGPYTREGQTVGPYNAWIFGEEFITDGSGNGSVTVTLSANSGTWDVQFFVVPDGTTTPSYESEGIFGTTVEVIVLP